MKDVCLAGINMKLKTKTTETPEKINGLIVIGLAEPVVIKGKDHTKSLKAKIDTGATKSSIDQNLAGDLNLGPVKKTRLVKSAHGHKIRPVIEAEIEMSGQIFKAEFTLADRNHMKYPVLIGQNILKKGFLINPSKADESKKRK